MSGSSTDLWNAAMSDCCQEPVNKPGAVQAFGALIVTDLNLEIITHVSANVAEMLGLRSASSLPESKPPIDKEAESPLHGEANWDGKGVLGRSLRELLPRELVHDLANVCGLSWIETQREWMGAYEINGRSFNICVHVQGDRTLIELEPQATVERSQTLATRLKVILQGNENDLVVLSRCAQELRYATGFDRVMVYRFLPDGAGEVIAEARASDIESFLHLRFPATDIPELARQIFFKIALRPIPDLSAPLVPILSWDEAEAPLDLSLTWIRGASLAHTQEYLPNMGIAGSMTLAINVGDKLWGLFAFHHRQPKLLSPEFRNNLETCGLLISLYVKQYVTEKHFTHQQDATKLLTQLFGQQIRTENSWQTLVTQSMDQLCELVSADGLSFISDQTILASHGDVPASSTILKLVDQTQAQGHGDILALNSLSRFTEWGGAMSPEEWQPSAGILLVPINFNSPYYLAFFRNETISEVTWAGNPNESKVVLPGKNVTGVQMTPQRSFEAYKQLVEGYSRPWSSQALSIVRELRDALEPEGFLQARQSLIIAELKHRVKNILALILSVARQTRRSAKSVEHYLQVLEQRISALAMAHDLVTGKELLWPSLRDLLSLELQPYLSGDADSPQIKLAGPNVTLNSNFVPTFILVIHELVSNAVKYGALSVPTGQLTVHWFEDKGGLMLLWREAGGPTVSSPAPEERGFGCELIERAIPYEFNGKASLCFAPLGMEANFWLPTTSLVKWESVEEALSPILPATQGTVMEKVPAQRTPALWKKLDGKSVLLVEDNMMIALEMENLLRESGFSTVDSAPTVDRAIALLNSEPHDYQVCLLDINLKTETSFAIAHRVRQAQIPLAFISGYDSKHPIPEGLQDIPLLKKPVNSNKLSTMLLSLLEGI